MKKKINKAIIILLVISMVCSTLILFTSCSDDTVESLEILDLDTLDYIDDIQTNGDLIFEWLYKYNSARPTVVIFHGETTDNSADDFSMNLDESEYTEYDVDTNPTDYVVTKNLQGYYNNGYSSDLSYYWHTVAQYNVVVFHWESFADDDLESIASKFYTTPKQRYRNEDGTYETNEVPNADLVSIVTSLYIEEMDGLLNGKEVRFVGNGVGANLALSVSDQITTYYNAGLLDGSYLPTRLALCDPYLSVDDLHLEVNWDTTIETTEGTLGMINSMLTKVTNIGTVVEMIESKEMSSYTVDVVDEDGVESETELYDENYAYDIDRKDATISANFDEILTKVAYLEIAESYSLSFSDEYKAFNRISLDWYLYSIIGSDDTTVGYPTSLSSTSSTCNWGTRDTRPMLNNRYATNDVSSSAASNMGKNYGVSAWTPTTYTRALKGISFTLQERTTNATSNVHGNMTYNYSDYIMEYFQSENYQKSNQDDYTLICGYIYYDENEDSFINDGTNNGIADAIINFDITSTETDEPIEANFDVYTDSDGFYTIKLMDKVVDENGDESSSGYKFDVDYTVTLTYMIATPTFVYQTDLATGIYYETVDGHNFNSSKSSFTLNYYYADAITIKNCLIIPESTDE
jgi:hypothetical protein